jgi:hypothetical protein
MVRSLVAQGPVPADFDETRLRTMARTLVNKRRTSLARIWPSLVKAVGDSYTESFTKYAQSHSMPVCATPRGDGRAYLSWLATQHPLSDTLFLEAMAFDLRFLSTPQGLRPRSRFRVRMARLPQSRKLVIALRLPWLGERWWGVPQRP